MISCTEFIPAYSTMFTYLEEKYGPQEVPTYWEALFVAEEFPLYKIIAKEGLRGCFTYWSHTLNEEAADFTMCLNEKRGFFIITMHHCPSKGRLLELQESVGMKPYRNYCLHCDHYRASIEPWGLKYIYNFSGIDHAACSILVYDPNVFDGRVIIDEDTTVMDRQASDNEYFHPDFHSSMNKGVAYMATERSESDIRAFLEKFVDEVYWPVAKAAQEKGLAAIEEKILDTYTKEHALDAVKTELTDDSLTVTVSYCPAEKHLRSLGEEVHPLFKQTTEVVMEKLAKNSGFGFTMEYYNPENGAAKYVFTK